MIDFALRQVIYEVMERYPYKNYNFLFGEIMRQTKGVHEPVVVRRELKLLRGGV